MNVFSSEINDEVTDGEMELMYNDNDYCERFM